MDDGGDTRKRPSLNDTVSDNFSNKKPKPLYQTLPPPQPPSSSSSFDLLNDDVFAELSMDEEELTKLLNTPTCPFPFTYNSCPTPCPVKFVSYPYVAPPVEFSSSSYVTINGNEETCGSSFSDTDSSVMASFDTASVSIADPLAIWGVACGGAWSGGDEAAAREGCGGGGGDDDWDWNELLFGDEVGKQADSKGVFGCSNSN